MSHEHLANTSLYIKKEINLLNFFGIDKARFLGISYLNKNNTGKSRYIESHNPFFRATNQSEIRKREKERIPLSDSLSSIYIAKLKAPAHNGCLVLTIRITDVINMCLKSYLVFPNNF